MKGKLKAFILPPNEILTNIDPEETGFINQYTRAISLYRTSELELSLSIINQLIKKFPQDPWFRELKGQFLFETGHIEESIQPYIKAVALAPRAPLLRLGLARAQIETNKEINLIAAIRNLKVASQIEADYPPFWYFLGVAFGRLEMFADADLALAEYALIRGQNKKSMHHAKRAYSALGKGSPQSQRALDIINLIENKL
jgi:predicted Zn-dependent protease